MILKAKNSDTNQWEEVSLSNYSDDERFFYLNGNFYLKDSICRPTEATDSNGKRIYENDKLVSVEGDSRATVAWLPERNAFYIAFEISEQSEVLTKSGFYVKRIHTTYYTSLTSDEAKKWTVYGNTFDDHDD